MKVFAQYWLLVVCIGLLVCGCGDKRISLVDRGNYKKWIQRLEIGYAYDNQPATSHVILGDLKAYIDKHKDRIYKGDESRFIFHEGLMQLYSSDFFTSFRTLKKYTHIAGDIVGPYYHIGQVLGDQFLHTGYVVSSLCAIAQLLPGQTQLVLGQQRALLSVLDDRGYPFDQVGDDVLTDEVKATKEYKDVYQGYLTTKSTLESTLDNRMEWRSGFQGFTEGHIIALESKLDLSKMEIDFLVQYYIHPYYTDYEKAAMWADKRKDQINRGDISTYTIVTNMMRAYLSMDRFDDAIDVFKRNQNQVSPERRKLKESQHHINLYLSAAHAGKREFDRSLEYLERELSITEIHKSWLRTESPKTLADLVTNGDMLYSLFAVVFLLDEFEEFEKAGRYGEIEELVERYVSRYTHLPVFNR